MEKYHWLFYALAGALAAALIAPLAKKGTNGLDPSVVTAVRSIVQALVVIGVVTALGLWGNLRQFTSRAFGMAVLAGIAGAISWLCMFKALASEGGDVARVGPIDKLSMPISVVIAVILLNERPSTVNWIGVAVMAAGAYLVAHR